jgi:hypothetical protein
MAPPAQRGRKVRRRKSGTAREHARRGAASALLRAHLACARARTQKAPGRDLGLPGALPR